MTGARQADQSGHSEKNCPVEQNLLQEGGVGKGMARTAMVMDWRHGAYTVLSRDRYSLCVVFVIRGDWW